MLCNTPAVGTVPSPASSISVQLEITHPHDTCEANQSSFVLSGCPVRDAVAARAHNITACNMGNYKYFTELVQSCTATSSSSSSSYYSLDIWNYGQKLWNDLFTVKNYTEDEMTYVNESIIIKYLVHYIANQIRLVYRLKWNVRINSSNWNFSYLMSLQVF